MFNALKMVVVQPLLGLIDCASINFGINSSLRAQFSSIFRKKHCQHNLLFWLVLQLKIIIQLIVQPIFFGLRSVLTVLQANLSNKLIFLSAYFYIHETWVPQKMTHNSLQRTQRIRITSSLTQDGVPKLVAIF